jgi:hypothetical protein
MIRGPTQDPDQKSQWLHQRDVVRSFFAGFGRQSLNLSPNDFAQYQQLFTLLDQAISNRFSADLSFAFAIQSGFFHKLPLLNSLG